MLSVFSIKTELFVIATCQLHLRQRRVSLVKQGMFTLFEAPSTTFSHLDILHLVHFSCEEVLLAIRHGYLLRAYEAYISIFFITTTRRMALLVDSIVPEAIYNLVAFCFWCLLTYFIDFV